MTTYQTITHRNSNNSRRRGLLVSKDGLPCVYESIQLVRATYGHPAPRMETPATLRSFRSKYERHVGKKQLAKTGNRKAFN